MSECFEREQGNFFFSLLRRRARAYASMAFTCPFPSLSRNEQARDNLSTTFRARLSPKTMKRLQEQRAADEAEEATAEEDEENSFGEGGSSDADVSVEAASPYRSPIVDLLYGRWIEGLRNRWGVAA